MTASREQLLAPADPSRRASHLRRTLAEFTLLFAVIAGLTYAALSMAWPFSPVTVHVRWSADLAEDERAIIERQFTLTQPEHAEGLTWRYALTDASSDNIRRLVQHPAVNDTAHLNRARYRPEFEQDRPLRQAIYAAATGGIGMIGVVLLAAVRRRITLVDTALPARSELTARPPHPARDEAGESATTAGRRRSTNVALTAAAVLSVAMHLFAGTSLPTAAAALASLYICGYVVGALLVAPVGVDLGLALAVIRTTAGLLLTTIGCLLSLVLSVPWFVGPGILVASAVSLRRRAAFLAPRVTWRFGWHGVAAGVVALTLLSPIWMTFAAMAPGPYPPVFYNIDTAYTLEKVHALVAADSYPPASLSNLGIRRTYHYGSQAMAAFLSRISGLSPHHSLFMVVLPLLTAGVLASAVAAARHLGPAVPLSLSVPLLLLSIPSLSRSFWHTFGPQLWNAVTLTGLSVDQLVGDMSLWGVLSNESMNVGGDFVILATIAGLAAAPVLGWALPAFLIGSAMLVKTTVGVALVAGCGVSELWRTLTATRLSLSRQALAAAAWFTVTFVAFFVLAFESNFHLELMPFYHLGEIVMNGTIIGSTFDVLWLSLPALIVLTAGLKDPERRSAPFLLMAIGPVLVVNISRLDNTRVGGGGTGDDWLQILHVVPFLLHAFALSVAARRWSRLSRPRRVAFVIAAALAIGPVTLAAGRYSSALLHDPDRGTDFVDNRSLAAALGRIPVSGTVLVTNDLRYPAGHFARDYRQMQIPALFGHQAFAVNYAHEAVEERRGLQLLLQQPQWSEAITDAARTHGWTHLLIRKDYDHATDIPLPQLFENADYAVFRF